MHIKVSRSLTRDEIDELLNTLTEDIENNDTVPPELKTKLKDIQGAVRQANLFIVNIGEVDFTLIDIAVQLRSEYDKLHEAWGHKFLSTAKH